MSTRPMTVACETSLDDALDLMDRYEVRHLPVVEGTYMVGIVSDRDLLEFTGWLPSRVHACRGPRASDAVPTRIGEVMNRQVARVAPSEPVERAALGMLQRKLGCLPVEENGVLVGIVTETDLLDAFLESGRRDPRLSVRARRVAGHMTHSPVTIAPHTTIAQVRELLFANDVRHLPVLENGRLTGIVSDRDMRRASGQGRRDTTSASAVMSRNPTTVDPDTTFESAALLLLQHKISALPVLDGADELVGILTLQDVLDEFLGEIEEAANP